MTIAKNCKASADGENVVCGKKQTLRALAEGKAQKIILAAAADEPLKEEIRMAATRQGVRVQTYPTKKGLGVAMGLDVACGVVTYLAESNASLNG